ncbi:alpha-L-rhamnosidase C-terminal domain-containing protein [Acidipila sp. EB88]|uniref:alpha-L-rhamnosidase-related protein n=1 Tax=Acidipila sp. EB88 TaxID=2305226 RepID=UPI000F5FB91E|nr:alpha-L-rhamnosidase C-terminal domain-containing protein [Acidipila sp. EB88]RRA49138.1 alpha-L-rhamnosidase [Acidipila sp. EB88]
MIKPRLCALYLGFLPYLSGMIAGGQISATRAEWIGPAGASETTPALGVYEFRKVLSLAAVPKQLRVQVSADNRFELFVNGTRVGEGPARGDLQHWRYESYDLAPLLHAGTNVVAARVWNFGDQSPEAQLSLKTGLVVWTKEPAARALDTNASWQVRAETAWRFVPTGPPTNSNTGPDEVVDGVRYDWHWAEEKDASAGWSAAQVIAPAEFATSAAPATRTSTWKLLQDALPPMENAPEGAGQAVRGSGDGFPEKEWTVPPHSRVQLLLDHKVLMTAFPELAVRGGAGSRVRLRYAEALLDEHGLKGNRNEIAGKHMSEHGIQDEFFPGGGPEEERFAPLWWRTWRFLEVDVETGDQPLQMERLAARQTWYPLHAVASFQSSDPELGKIWDVGWRTLRVDAHETYMDCPYYEQTQYIGDSRIEALVTYAVSGDDRLGRQALRAFADTVQPSGLTESRGPAHDPQVIPPFSLLWVGMLHDFWMYRPDAADEVRELLPIARGVLSYFAEKQRADGLLGKLPQKGDSLWNFVDWTEPFPGGTPPQDADGGSVPLSLQWAAALRDAADLEAALGDQARSDADRAGAQTIIDAVRREAWNAKAGLLADTPGGATFSEHANILGVLLDAVPGGREKAVVQRVLDGEKQQETPSLAPASYYFRFYLARALNHAGMGAQYLDTLRPWRTMLQLGLTTWAEQPEPTRSDAHAWSSHPNYDLLTTVAGIQTDAPGFAKVRIAPQPGDLAWLNARMPHPKGMIEVKYRRVGNKAKFTVQLPEGIDGRFVWGGTSRPLHGGKQSLEVPLP